MKDQATALLRDENARVDIINKLDENFFVEAGAGSGKTASLILRLVNLTTKGGVELSNVAAITFTEAAATELKLRLRAALQSIAEKGTFKDPDDEDLDYSNYKEQAKRALEALPGVAIGTLHSFCLGIIRQYPLDAGVPPEVNAVGELMGNSTEGRWVTLTEDIVNSVLKGDEESIEFIDSLIYPGSGEQFREALNVLLSEDVKSDSIRSAIAKLDESWGELEKTRLAAIPETPEPMSRSDVESAAAQIEELINACTDPEQDKLYNDILQPNLEKLKKALETDGDVRAPKLLKKKVGSTKFWKGSISVEQARAKNNELTDYFATRNKEIDTAPLLQAASVARRVLAYLAEYFARKRRQAGELEFHDMLYLAHELVHIPHVREDLHKQYTHILVDEFQDTDPIQNEVVRAIAGDGGEPTPGALFTVGDPKQSIYRFRRADIATYMTTRPQEDNEGFRELTQNFRSAPQIIGAVNELFGYVFENFQNEGDRLAPVPFTPLTAGCSFDGKALFLSHLDEDWQTKSEDRVAAENEDILAAIRDVQSGKWEVTNEKTKKTKTLGLSDIVILVRSRSVAERVLAVLHKNGIPAKKEKTAGLFEIVQVNDVISVLRAIADPADRFAEAVALRSPLLGCSDNELAEYKLSNMDSTESSSDSLNSSSGSSKVGKALDVLKEWRKQAKELSVGQVVQLVISETNVLENLAELQWFDALDAVRALQELAYDFDVEMRGTLREFVSWADGESNSKSEFAEPVLDLGQDAVTIMTIHNSKGRQFPIVIVAGMAGGTSSDRDRQFFNRETDVLEIKFSDICQTSEFETVSDLEKKEGQNEDLRLQYVAMTRAKAGLIVPLGMQMKKPGKNDGISWPYSNKAGSPYLTALMKMDSPLLVSREEAFPDGVSDEGVEEPTVPMRSAAKLETVQTTFETTSKSLKAAAERLPRIAATRIAHSDSQDKKSEGLTTAQMSEGALVRTSLFEGSPINEATVEPVGGYPVGSSGTSFGTAVHEAMEAVFENDDVDSVCETVASTYQLPDKELTSLKTAVQSLAGSEVFTRALEASGVWTELPIIGAAELDDNSESTSATETEDKSESETKKSPRTIAIDGVIDLLYKEDDGTYVIADYKTDGSADANQVASYFGQLYVYSKLLPVPVSRLELVFARHGQAQVRTLDLA